MNGTPRSAIGSALVLLAFGIAACGGSDSSGPPKAGPPTALTIVSGNAQEGQSGEALATPLMVKVADNAGLAVSNAVVRFAILEGGGTLSAAQDTTDANGQASVTWTMGSLLGDARAEARVSGILAPALFTATVKAGPPSEMVRASAQIGSVAGGFDVGDSVAVRVNDRFGHPVTGATVAFAVTAGGGSVSHATKPTGTDGVARTAWTIGTTGTQTLRASAGALQTEVTAIPMNCSESQLAVGDALTIGPGAASCVVLTGNAQRYVVTVVNTTNNVTSTGAFRFRGAGATAASGSTTSAPAFRSQGLASSFAAELREAREANEAHADLRRANAQLIDRLGPAARAQFRLNANVDRQVAPPPNVGDILPVRIPRDFSNLCNISSAASINARVVFVGTRGVVLEDTTNTLKGEFDAVYRNVGEEFDNVMWPILTTNFGNPLAMDPQTDNNQRVFMVFSKEVATIAGGNVAGFVTSSDFFTPAQGCAASNVGEYFYARNPTSAGTGFDTDNSTQTADEWLRATRTVIIHEVKHITSFAERLASPELVPSGFFQKDMALEEGGAMIAEELWARGIFGYAQRGNVDYASSIFCEVRPTTPACAGKPVAMIDHFFFLYEYERDVDNRSIAGSISSDDATFYGSNWAFIRWVLDHYAASEANFLKAMIAETQKPGVENIEARTGKSFIELLSEFSLALTLDDYPGFTAKNAKHTQPSWNTRNMFTGLNTDFASQGFFTVAVPLKTRALGFGKFLFDVSSLRGGSISVSEVSGAQTAKQLFEFNGLAGTTFPADMRVNIVRVQ